MNDEFRYGKHAKLALSGGFDIPGFEIKSALQHEVCLLFHTPVHSFILCAFEMLTHSRAHTH